MTPKSDSGARTYRFKNLHFDDATIKKRVFYQSWFKGIYHDLDGTLTGLGPDSYTTPDWTHNRWPECTLDYERFDGLVCPSSNPVRRVAFHGGTGNIDGKKLYIWQYDNSIVKDMTPEELEDYLLVENASEVT